MKFLQLLLILNISIFASENILIKAKESGLKPIPSDKKKQFDLINNKKNKLTKEKFVLGKKLFFDPRLSKSGLISCNTCHNLGTAGVDGLSVAIGHNWAKNPHELNSPTVYNAVFAENQFWDGRNKTLEEQAQGPIQAEPEMNATKEHVKNLVNSIPEYKKAFEKIKKDNSFIPTIKDVADVIAVYERTLITRSKYDDFLEGKEEALSKDEKEGLGLFIDRGCVSCHNGIALGGTMQLFPVVNPYKYASGDFKGNKEGLIKVPTLRNIEETAPYFHNGKVWTLREAIEIMGDTQLGIKLKKEEVEKIEVFLKSLTGSKPTIKYPILPNRTNQTDKPQP